ncbi:MAG: DUF1343 domain-containing protein [Bacteroidales bacterium]|jgi:uncharacterized protein YbbC (DUF1343 family)|nr:DUF1343 domain-containing protein [Bacteroidales bacterium]
MKRNVFIAVLAVLLFVSNDAKAQSIVCGAERTEVYLPFIEGKRIAVVANQTSVIGNVHLVDSLLRLGVDVKKIFAPEHGFRGNVEAGGKVNSNKDDATGLNVVSLYGKKIKPSEEDLQDIDIVIFDIQDVGCRFFTYISTLHYVMEAVAQNNKALIVLDRPNPNGFYIAGTLLSDTSLVSFVGLHPVPIVYGMTIGEYAKMINAEGWLGTSAKRVMGETSDMRCDLTIVPLLNYTHDSSYVPPIPPSPNLRTEAAIILYPSLCLFEGTPVSVGRGTDKPFEIIGFPNMKADNKTIEFTPRAIKGISDNPPYRDEKCIGVLIDAFDWHYDAFRFYPILNQGHEYYNMENFRNRVVPNIIDAMYRIHPQTDKFFTPFFDKLAGTKDLQKVITGELNYEDVKSKWAKELYDFGQMRKKYLLYADFSANEQ